MKHDYLITNTAYKMLYQASFLQLVYRYQIKRNVQTQNTDLSNIEIWKDVFENATESSWI